jgi:tyrosinase
MRKDRTICKVGGSWRQDLAVNRQNFSMSVNVGPLSPSVDTSENTPRNPRADGYGYNPRCLRRDVNSYFTTQFIRPVDIANHINSTSDMLTFETSSQTDTAKAFCLHTSGHYTIWGDPGGDFYVSPGEPVFWLHHGQVDRHWWIWQNQDPANRVQQYKGGTVFLAAVSPAGHITDVQNINVVAPKGFELLESKSLVSSTGGPFCYVYE